MNEKRAKLLLRRMHRSFTAGSILHLLSDLHREAGVKAAQANDEKTCERHRAVEHALFVVGMGVDAALPT
ncbi:MAG: hypothetical protein ACKVP0_06775 [Pirellulaceae bacterium]